MPHLLEAKNLSFMKPANGEVSARSRDYLLNGISLSLDKGDIFGVTGPSGAGKSTLLKLLCRLEEASSGDIYLNGHSIGSVDPRAWRRKITMVFQSATLMGPTVYDDLSLALRWNPGPVSTLDPAVAVELLNRAHLTERFLKLSPKNLSVGEAQRVALARALAADPEVLLLDEPTSALDPESKAGIEDSIQSLARDGTGVIMVTHDPKQMEKMARHGLSLNAGKIEQVW